MHLYSHSFSTIATIASLIMSDLLPACFSCSNNFNLPQSLLGLSEAMIAGDLTNDRRNLALVLLLPKDLPSKYISSAKSNVNSVSCELARSVL